MGHVVSVHTDLSVGSQCLSCWCGLAVYASEGSTVSPELDLFISEIKMNALFLCSVSFVNVILLWNLLWLSFVILIEKFVVRHLFIKIHIARWDSAIAGLLLDIFFFFTLRPWDICVTLVGFVIFYFRWLTKHLLFSLIIFRLWFEELLPEVHTWFFLLSIS